MLETLRARPDDVEARRVYADWLEERGDQRATLVRAALSLAPLPVDHPDWRRHEAQLAGWRECDESWRALLWPTDAQSREPCSCFGRAPATPARFHRDIQDVESPGWLRLLELVDIAAADGRTEFAPGRDMTRSEWADVVTLPPSIASLTKVETLVVYGSHLSRLPLELAQMTSLTKFVPYTSYRLHWFPYELTRLPHLTASTVSTRAIFGNFKNRAPFPALTATPPASRACSVCQNAFTDIGEHRVWISKSVATDVLPLLVNACSVACVEALGEGAANHVAEPHRGGSELSQPPDHRASRRR